MDCDCKFRYVPRPGHMGLIYGSQKDLKHLGNHSKQVHAQSDILNIRVCITQSTSSCAYI